MRPVGAAADRAGVVMGWGRRRCRRAWRARSAPDGGRTLRADRARARTLCGLPAGQPVRRLRSAAAAIAAGRRSARLEGFSLHADVAVPALSTATQISSDAVIENSPPPGSLRGLGGAD